MIEGISQKFDVKPNRVIRVTHINSKGLQIVVDEDVVREIQEGQDMIVEFTPAATERTIQKDPTDSLQPLVDDHLRAVDTNSLDPLELWLNF